ncbi:MAG TPA: immunoglobulin domain-containing protein, partial [Phycisphaerae bacterium]|nr:immunoglobulin domain-containing protein [Phycisphaerae bacterium]
GGWTLTEVRDVTINGNVVTLCGNGTNPEGNPEAWIARYALPEECQPAVIEQEPGAATEPFGGAVQFDVVASGTEPLSYQWHLSDEPLADGVNGCGGIVSGATTATLVLQNVTSADEGDYTVVVTNECGSDTSAAAALTVTPPAVCCQADVNDDGQINAGDIQDFVDALLTGQTCQ